MHATTVTGVVGVIGNLVEHVEDSGTTCTEAMARSAPDVIHEAPLCVATTTGTAEVKVDTLLVARDRLWKLRQAWFHIQQVVGNASRGLQVCSWRRRGWRAQLVCRVDVKPTCADMGIMQVPGALMPGIRKNRTRRHPDLCCYATHELHRQGELNPM